MKETEAATPPLAPRDGQALRGRPWTRPPGRHIVQAQVLPRPGPRGAWGTTAQVGSCGQSWALRASGIQNGAGSLGAAPA